MDSQNSDIKDGHFFELYGAKKIISNKVVISLISVLVIFYFMFFASPFNFANGKSSYVFKVVKGETAKEVSVNLKKEKIIKSSMLFDVFFKLLYSNKNVKAGDYLFNHPQNLFTILSRVVNGESGIVPIEIVLPEGTSSKEMAEIFFSKLHLFNKKEFIKLSAPLEGELFPDTYLFSFDAQPADIVQKMHENFTSKIDPLRADIKKTGRTEKQIINMASIIEEEGREYTSKRMISGILWKRLDIGMPLQVDAVFRYVNGKHSFTLSSEDLKEDSPYNTYTRKGLPPTPITNPGLTSIKAAIYPRKSNYLYYLTGKDGEMYYAVTHDEHVLNKEKYLK
jgi:UPF0755 protein